MNNNFEIENIRKAWTNAIDRYTAIIDAWKAVTFPTKKDGTPFANMSKNISGAKYSAKSFALQPGENEITVSTWSATAGYVGDSIDVYESIRYMKDSDPRKAKTQNYQPKQTYLTQIYKFDIDDIKEAIAKRIAYYEQVKAEKETDLQSLEKNYNDFEQAVSNAYAKLKNNCNNARDIRESVFKKIF